MAIKGVIEYLRKNGLKKTFQMYGKLALGIKDYSEEIDTLFYFLNKYADIASVPPADGVLRDLQLNDVLLLQIFDKFCEANGLEYWLDYGTLLGGVRHKGFIPWDDDLDVAMPRDDYERAKPLLQSFFTKWGLSYYSNANSFFESIGIGSGYSGVWIDIFPMDVFHGTSNKEHSRNRFDEFLENYYKTIVGKNEHDWDKIGLVRQQLTSQYETGEEMYYWSYSPYLSDQALFFDKSEIYPLDKHIFENIEVFYPHREHEVLLQLYGKDYMRFPKNGVLHHFSVEKIDIEVIKQKNADLINILKNMC